MKAPVVHLWVRPAMHSRVSCILRHSRQRTLPVVVDAGRILLGMLRGMQHVMDQI